MAITRHAALILRGESADTKPTTNILKDTLFIETNTRLIFLYDGAGTWNPIGGTGGGATTLDSLTDVIAPSPAPNDILKYDGGTSVWKPAAETGGSFTASSTSTLTNKKVGDVMGYVKVSTPADPANVEEGIIYFKQIDSNNNGFFVKQKEQGVIVERRLTPG